MFSTADSLALAKVAVHAPRRTFGTGAPAWLDTARTRAETRPLRAIHRLAEILADYEAQRSDKASIHKDMAAKAVSVGN